MLRALLAVAAFVLVSAAPARAVVYEIPLTGLQGTYGEQSRVYERIMIFHLPGLPAEIRGASLHVRGTAEVGAMLCGFPQTEYPWPTQLEGALIESVSPLRLWDAFDYMPVEPGKFEWTAAFRTRAPYAATWAFLMDGEGEARLWGGPGPILLGGCVTTTPAPNVTVEEATLLIDADIPVPAISASWGRLKTTYR